MTPNLLFASLTLSKSVITLNPVVTLLPTAMRLIAALSLDGGGQLSFLQLVILREILYRLQEKLGLSVMPLVCEHFDVIGGSGSGGIVALLLGRFQLSINDAIPCFLDLYKGLYNDSLDKKARSALLAEGLKALVYKHLSPVDPDIRLQEDSPSCKTFVCTMPSVTITGSKPVRLFRNFRARELPSFDCAIWAAAQATTAHPKFFEPIKIGPAWAQEEFLDPGLGYNNPIEVVIEETRSIHSSTENDQCFLSLGTGHPGPSVGSVGGDGWAVLLQDIAMDCERIADRVERISSLRHLRLNVTQGLQSISFGEWIDPARLMSHTTQYLQGVDVSSRIGEIVGFLEKRHRQRYERVPPVTTFLSEAVSSMPKLYPWNLHPEKELFRSEHFRIHSGRYVFQGMSNRVTIQVFGGRMAQERKNLAITTGAFLTHPRFLTPFATSVNTDPNPFIVFHQDNLTPAYNVLAKSLLIANEDTLARKGIQLIGNLASALEFLESQSRALTQTRLHYHEFLVLANSEGSFLVAFTPSPLDEARKHQTVTTAWGSGQDDPMCLSSTPLHTARSEAEYGRIDVELLEELCSTTIVHSTLVAHRDFERPLLHEASPNFEVHTSTVLLPAPDSTPFSPWGFGHSSRHLREPCCIPQLDEQLRVPSLEAHTTSSSLHLFTWQKSATSSLTISSIAHQYSQLIEMSRQYKEYRLLYCLDQTDLDYTRHACPRYRRDEIRLSLSSRSNSILLYDEPEPGELCPACGNRHQRPISPVGAEVGWPEDEDEEWSTDGLPTLYGAVKTNSLAVVQLLLSEGADVNQSHALGDTLPPLRFAARYGLLPMVQLLVENGAHVNVRDSSYGSPLQAAALAGHVDIVKFLLEKGANVNAGGPETSALWAAVKNGHLAIIRLLLEAGADLNAYYGGPRALLYRIVKTGRVDLVQLLLESGADVNSIIGARGTALHVATTNGYLDIIQLLIEAGVDIDAVDGNHRTALYRAVKKRDIALIQLLLDGGADMNVVGGLYGTPLCAAAAEGPLEVVQLLIEAGADVHAVDENDRTALYCAAEGGDIGAIQLLLEKGADVNAISAEYGAALHAAVANGHLDAVRFLVEAGADVDAADDKNRTALYRAAKRGDTGIIKLLLEEGVDVNVFGGRYGTALCAAAAKGHLEIFRLLFEKMEDVGPHDDFYSFVLRDAADGGNVDIVQLLLEKGADVNAAGGLYGNALYAAAANNYLDVVQLLIEEGADVDAVDENDRTALCCAAECGETDVIQLLLEKGADVNAVGAEYGTALHAAVANGHLDAVRFLVEAGADINATDEEHRTALFCATEEGEIEVIQLLLAKGADIDAVVRDKTVVEVAAAHNHLDIFKLLLEKGANVSGINGSDKSLLQIFAIEGKVDVVQLLLEAGADVNMADENHWTVLMHAILAGHTDIVQLLLEKGADANVANKGGGTALHLAAEEGHLDIVRSILEKGVDVNIASKWGETALKAAVSEAHIDIVRLLLEKGADTRPGVLRSPSALEIATQLENAGIVQLLIQYGAERNELSRKGEEDG